MLAGLVFFNLMIAIGTGQINSNYDNQFLDFKYGLINKENNGGFAMGFNQLYDSNICLNSYGKWNTSINFTIGLSILLLFIIKNCITLVNADFYIPTRTINSSITYFLLVPLHIAVLMLISICCSLNLMNSVTSISDIVDACVAVFFLLEIERVAVFIIQSLFLNLDICCFIKHHQQTFGKFSLFLIKSPKYNILIKVLMLLLVIFTIMIPLAGLILSIRFYLEFYTNCN